MALSEKMRKKLIAQRDDLNESLWYRNAQVDIILDAARTLRKEGVNCEGLDAAVQERCESLLAIIKMLMAERDALNERIYS